MMKYIWLPILCCLMLSTQHCSDVQPSEKSHEKHTSKDSGIQKESKPITETTSKDSPLKGKLLINEVAASGAPSDWVEVYNAGTTPIDLTQVNITDDLAAQSNKTPLKGRIQPGEYKVFQLDSTWPGFKLKGDEEVGLFDSAGRLIDSANWDEGESPKGGSFGRIPNLTGPFKKLYSPTPGKANVDEKPAPEPQPEPSTPDAGPAPDKTMPPEPTPEPSQPDQTNPTSALVINEISAAGDPNDWFELYNGGKTTIDLSKYSVADDLTDKAARVLFPAGTQIKPGEYKMFELTTKWPNFKLKSDEELGLFDAQGNTVDHVDWKKDDSPSGQSYGRSPNGTGPFKTQTKPTPGKANP